MVTKLLGSGVRNNLAKGLALSERDFGRADKLKHGEERQHKLAARVGALEKLSQVQLARREHHVAQALHHLREAYLLALNLHQDFFFVARENLLEDTQEIEESNGDFRVLLVRLKLAAREDCLLDRGARPEHLRRSLVLLMLKKLVDELIARVEQLFGNVFEGIARQEHLRLDFNEGRRHH